MCRLPAAHARAAFLKFEECHLPTKRCKSQTNGESQNPSPEDNCGTDSSRASRLCAPAVIPRSVHSIAQTRKTGRPPIFRVTITNHYQLDKFGSVPQPSRNQPHPCPPCTSPVFACVRGPVLFRSVHSPAQTRKTQRCRYPHVTETNHYQLDRFGFLPREPVPVCYSRPFGAPGQAWLI